MILRLKVIFWYLSNFIFILFNIIKDFIKRIKTKAYKKFDKFGLHIFLGSFGSGKTCAITTIAYSLSCKYKDMTILTNYNLFNFPKHTKILPLNTYEDIINAPHNTLILIDEIGTLFNSRDFSAGKSLPKILFQHICQCRHVNKMILATAQDWMDIDVQLRRKVSTVNLSIAHLKYPYSRAFTIWTYDAKQYDLAYINPMYPIKAIDSFAYLQTDKIRSMYDTKEMIDTLLHSDYLDDDKIAANQSISSPRINDVRSKNFRKTLKNMRNR